MRIDWYERLALGSHLFSGSSLHTNRTNQQFSTSGIGAADVSIPVNEILPQELSKTMTAEVGQTYTWDVTKSANPTSLSFTNTCADTAGSRSAQVQITVSWTRSGPTASGATTIMTEVTAINPAHRTITVQATDKIYEGSGQTTLLHQVTGSAVDVPANTSMVVLSHTQVYGGSATTFNDVATATYTDKLTGIAVPGATSATASASSQPAGGTPANASVVVSDTESITGTGLAFSVAAPSVGAFTGGYVAGASTTGPVGWQFTATNSGSVAFTKTVTDRPAADHERHAVRYGHDHRRRPVRARHGQRQRRHHGHRIGQPSDQQDDSRRIASNRRVGDLQLRHQRAWRLQ